MSDSLGLDEPPQPRSPNANGGQPYRVLARKYRSQTFGELIGQDAMVQTLGNAIKRDRLAHAFLLTGIRGVGKTSTARLIAKALNCVGRDGQGGPTIDPCGVCEPCVAIAEGRHIDVVEMDAASHTGVDDIREIIEAVRYAAVSARYKVYIIDEVHMLSKSAFNALLKTLEEPPAHVKFLFATTEVNKVPITVLSRCQRFDLRRIPAELLAKHFAHVVAAEKVQAEPEALALIARAAEGSARDGLSILDQAIAHAGSEGGEVTAAQVREMLGLSDRGAIRRLFGHLLAGDVAAVLDGIAQQHALGVEPAALLKGLLETVHGVTRAKATAQSKAGEDPALSVEEREAFADWASRLGFATLHRLWQLLLKGHNEVHGAALPREAAEMALLRVLHASQMPDPQELLRRLESGTLGAAPAASPPAASAPPPAAPPAAAAAPVAAAPAPIADEAETPPWEVEPTAAPAPATPGLPVDFPAMIALLEKSEPWLAQQIHDFASLIDYAPPALVLHPTRPLDMKKLGAALKAATGQIWDIATGDRPGAPTLLEQQRAREDAHRDAILNSPIVAAARAAFPDAELIEDSYRSAGS